MATQALDIAKKIWEHVSPRQIITPDEKSKSALELAQKLIYFFQAGESYYYLFNVSTAEFDYVSPSIEKVLGYKQEETTLGFLFEKIHPEDQQFFVNYENELGIFLHSLPK